MINRVRPASQILLNWRWWVCAPFFLLVAPFALLSVILDVVAGGLSFLANRYERLTNRVFAPLVRKAVTWAFSQVDSKPDQKKRKQTNFNESRGSVNE